MLTKELNTKCGAKRKERKRSRSPDHSMFDMVSVRWFSVPFSESSQRSASAHRLWPSWRSPKSEPLVWEASHRPRPNPSPSLTVWATPQSHWHCLLSCCLASGLFLFAVPSSSECLGLHLGVCRVLAVLQTCWGSESDLWFWVWEMVEVQSQSHHCCTPPLTEKNEIIMMSVEPFCCCTPGH